MTLPSKWSWNLTNLKNTEHPKRGFARQGQGSPFPIVVASSPNGLGENVCVSRSGLFRPMLLLRPSHLSSKR